MDRIILHHTDDLEDTPVVQALLTSPGISLERIDATALLGETEVELGLQGGLTRLYAGLSAPSRQSDMLRMAILYQQGGVYLDMDTVTVDSLLPLLDAGVFIGTERIVWPYWVYKSRSPVVWVRHLGLDLSRKLMRAAPGGWRAFLAVQGMYPAAANNAVIGAPARSPLCAAVLRRMAAMPADQIPAAYALGPDLVQAMLEETTFEDFTIHRPAAFYPLAPEISGHWFRPCRNAQTALAQIIEPATKIVHWYASVRTGAYVAEISPDYIRARRTSQLYSALVAAALPDLDQHISPP
jgi:hypothetical protein